MISPHMSKETLDNMMNQSHRIATEHLAPIASREHMARPYPNTDTDFLAIDVPSTYQQGFIPDGEEPPHGLLRVVASARKLHHFNAGILDAHRLKLQPDQIKNQLEIIKPKVVGLNPTSVNVPEAQLIAAMCDDLEIPYILGGIHATLDPKIAATDFPTYSAIVKGNGELAVGAALNTLVRNRHLPAEGVYYPGDTQTERSDYATKLNPERVPMVRQDELVEEPVYHHTVTLHGKPTEIAEATLFVTDGCPFDCTFCASPIMVNRKGKDSIPYMRPEMSRIIQEISHVTDDLGADAIHFLDDMAFVTEDHIKDLHAGLVGQNRLGSFIWRGLTRAPVIDRFSPETMERMVETGAWKIAMGVESGSDEMLKRIKKKVSSQQVIRAVEKLTKYGIQAKGFFIVGFPGETEAQICETVDHVAHLKELGMTEIAMFQFKPYPGTEEYFNVERTMPDVIPQLNYLRRGNTGMTGKAQFRSEQHDTWLPDDLKIADVRSGVVREYVMQTLSDFYR